LSHTGCLTAQVLPQVGAQGCSAGCIKPYLFAAMSKSVVLTMMSTNKTAPKYSIRPRLSQKERAQSAPGPGAYGFTNPDKDKFSRTPAFGFGSSNRDGRAFVGQPGPGAYTPIDPNWTAKKVNFGSEKRLGLGSRSSTPGPGTYDTRGGMEGLQKSISGRLDGGAMGRRSLTPGPGQYNPNFSSTESAPRYGFGSASRPNLLGASKMPGPGTYTPNCDAIEQSPPRYTLKPRRNPLKSSESPGIGPTYTQFA